MPHPQPKPAEIPISRTTYPPDALTPTLRKLARRAERRYAKRVRDAKRRRESKSLADRRRRQQRTPERLLTPGRPKPVDPKDVMEEFRKQKLEEMPLKNTHLMLWRVEKRTGTKLSTDEEISNVKRWRRRWKLLERQRKQIVINSPFNLTQKPIDLGPYPTHPTPRTPGGSLSAILWKHDD